LAYVLELAVFDQLFDSLSIFFRQSKGNSALVFRYHTYRFAIVVELLNITIIVTLPVTLVSGVRMVHGIETCKYCREIFAILMVKNALEIEDGIRFKQLLRFAQQYIDPKTAAPTLIRHLEYLRKKKIIKKVRKGPQNVVYFLSTADSPLFSEEDLELSRKWVAHHSQKFHSWTLERIIPNILQLETLSQLEILKLWLLRQLPGSNPEELALRQTMVRAFYKQYADLLLEAGKEREPLQYKEAIRSVEQMIEDLRKELFTVKSI
jgi:hypothetical protein